MDAIALVDPISSGEELKEYAKKSGYKIIGIFTLNLELAFANLLAEEPLFRHCDHIVASHDIEEVISKLKEIPLTIKAVIAAAEPGVEMADLLAAKLGLHGNCIELSKARRDKTLMRKVLKESGLTCPDFATCFSEKEVVSFAKSHRFPLMVKTPKGAATTNVLECDDLEMVKKAYDTIAKTEDCFGARSTCCIVEEYIFGQEYMINTFADGEKVHVTDCWRCDKVSFSTSKNVYYNLVGIPLDDPVLTPLKAYGIKVNEVFGILFGPAHIELKDDPVHGPTLIEVGARLAGVKLTQALKDYSNFNPYKQTIDVFVNGKTKVPESILYSKHFSMAFCPAFTGGKVKQILGIEEIKHLPSFQSYMLHIKVGDILQPTTSLIDMPMQIYLAHHDRKQMLADLERAHELFQIVATA